MSDGQFLAQNNAHVLKITRSERYYAKIRYRMMRRFKEIDDQPASNFF